MTLLTHLLWNSWATLALYLPIVVLVVVLAVRDRRDFGANWTTGLAIALGWFVLRLPVTIFVMAHADVEGAVMQAGPSPDAARAAVTLLYVDLMIAFTIMVIKIPWYTAVYHAAAGQWGRIRPDAFPLIQRRRPAPWRAIAGAAAFGVGAAALSAAVFRLLDADVPNALKQLSAGAPLAEQVSVWVRLPLLSLDVAGAALAAELVYRGVLLGWLLRLGRNSTAVAVEATLVVSLLGACVAAATTNAPPALCIQVFVTGVFFCEFARRSCIEAAIAGHVGLNVAALLIGAAMG